MYIAQKKYKIIFQRKKISLPRKQEELNACNIEFHCDIFEQVCF
jgi:hypothetical protein